MIRMCLILIFIFQSFLIFSQNKFVECEKIIHVPDFKVSSINLTQKMVADISGNKLIYYSFSRRHSDDTLNFYITDIITNRTIRQKLFVPNFTQNFFEPIAYCISSNDSFVALSFFKKILFLKRLNDTTLSFNKIIELDRTYLYIKLRSNELVLGDCYNYAGKGEKTEIAIYNFKKEKITLKINPLFNQIEFSHFNPKHWIDANDSLILFAQTSNYKIDLYNSTLKHLTSITRDIPDWVQIDSIEFSNIVKGIKTTEPGSLINTLAPFNDSKISRLESARFLDNSTILVSYFKYNREKNDKVRFFDLYKATESGSFELVNSDIPDRPNIGKLPLTKSNMFLLAFNYYTYVKDGYIFIFRPSAPIQYFGRPWYEVKADEDNYFESNEPILGIFTFKYVQ